ncbi:MAG: CinA family protein [Microbacteriaceae bacterium]
MSAALGSQAAQILATCRQRGFKLGFAESLTGGALCSAFVDVPGASDVVLGAVVAYATSVKQGVLGVDDTLILDRGVVNAEAAEQMARGGIQVLGGSDSSETSRLVVISTTGVAGPTEQDGARVGTVFIAIATDSDSVCSQHAFEGDRAAIRAASVEAALDELSKFLERT